MLGVDEVTPAAFGGPALCASGLVKRYANETAAVTVLDGVDFALAAGEFVAVMGASGSGKSTLLNILSCMDRPDAGTLAIEGEDVLGLGDGALAGIRNRKIGFVFQSFNLLRRTSAVENVALPLVYAGIGRRERRWIARQCLARLGVDSLADRFPGQLSGEQQQRVAIARAIVNDPTILIADEPTGALDTGSSGEILAIFRQCADAGIAIVMVTHDPAVAARADRILTLSDGRILGADPAR